MKKDFILRMIDQLGAAIARIMNLNRSGNPAEAQVSLDQAFRHATGFDREMLEQMPPETLVSLLITAKPPAVWLEPACILVRLLHEQAHVHRATGLHDAADADDLQAVFLLRVIQQQADGRTLLAITPGFAELLAAVPPAKYPPFLRAAIARYQANHTP